MIITRIV
jgi:hypothetical protein